MERADIKSILVTIVGETRGEYVDHLDDETNLREGLGFDSVDLVCMLVEVQNRFAVSLSMVEMESVVRVGDLLDLLQNRLGTPLFKVA